MKRRAFITLLGAAAASPFILPRPSQAAMPVIGFLHSASLEPNAKRLDAFKRGLQSAGFIEGQNVAIDYRWAGGQNAKLPELASELVKAQVTVIATLSSTPAT
ncbi:MAG TPA: ABC transporter substrate-binding protein, partial [Bradyrhizobium sp.]